MESTKATPGIPVPVPSWSAGTAKIPTRRTVRKFAEFLAPGYKLFDWSWVSADTVTADEIERETWKMIHEVVSEKMMGLRSGGLNIYVEMGQIRLGWEMLPVFIEGTEDMEDTYYLRRQTSAANSRAINKGAKSE